MNWDHMDRRGPPEDQFGFFKAILNAIAFIGFGAWVAVLLWLWWGGM